MQRSLDAAVAERDALATRLAEAEANLDRKSLLIKQLQLRNANLEHQLATFVHNSNSAADAASGRDSTANLRPGVSRSDSVASSQQQFEGMFDPEDGEHVRFDVDSPQFHIQVAEVCHARGCCLGLRGVVATMCVFMYLSCWHVQREELTAGLKSYLKSLLKEARRFCEVHRLSSPFSFLASHWQSLNTRLPMPASCCLLLSVVAPCTARGGV